MKKPTVNEERRHLAYARDALAGKYGELTPERRELLEIKRDTISKRLGGRCRVCGRTLRDPRSVAAGIGSECAAVYRLAPDETDSSRRLDMHDAGLDDEVA